MPAPVETFNTFGPVEIRRTIPLPNIVPVPEEREPDVTQATAIVDNAINGLQKRNVVLEDQLTALEVELRNKGARLADAELRLLDAEQRNINLETKMEDLRQENSDLRAKFSALIALCGNMRMAHCPSARTASQRVINARSHRNACIDSIWVSRDGVGRCRMPVKVGGTQVVANATYLLVFHGERALLVRSAWATAQFADRSGDGKPACAGYQREKRRPA